MGDDVEKAKRSQQEQGHSSEQDTHATQTLSRQEIISMVKKRFGLKPGGEMEKKTKWNPRGYTTSYSTTSCTIISQTAKI